MLITPQKIPDILLFTLKRFGDERGFFTERFREDLWQQTQIPFRFVQDNFSRSQPQVLRGMHAQFEAPQGKLVTCLSGHILDVVVDIRAQSPSCGQWVAVELKGDQPQWLWVPPGFAHGFCVLGTESADLLYKVTEYYNPKGEFGIHFADPDLAIPWPISNPLLSPKDLQLGSFNDYMKTPRF